MKATELTVAHWMGDGANIEELTDGRYSAGYAEMDLLVVVDTPAGAPAQKRHRDTILPGPCASIGVHIPLTHLQVEPLNGPIGFIPGSHVLRGKTDVEVVGAAPPGSVILYDSFTEHRGLENVSSEPRAALFAWFRVPGVYSGHTDENFGDIGLQWTDDFRRLLRDDLLEAHRKQRLRSPGALNSEKAIQKAEDTWGFRQGGELVTWGEEHVCFCCNRTTSEGSSPAPAQASTSRKGEWYCKRCWDASKKPSLQAPQASVGNSLPPLEQPDRVPDDRLEQLQAKGLNVRPGHGRHKLTLLRERGYFLPVDPVESWLDRVSNDPQPAGWKDALRKALGEVPRHDGF